MITPETPPNLIEVTDIKMVIVELAWTKKTIHDYTNGMVEYKEYLDALAEEVYWHTDPEWDDQHLIHWQVLEIKSIIDKDYQVKIVDQLLNAALHDEIDWANLRSSEEVL
jgi:hypothetical protein